MNDFYHKFLSQNISLEPYGIFPWSPDDEPYFCTPERADIIGRTGVDGVHYCFVKGCGEAVFAVSPCNAPGEYLHPVARNFEEFLSLLISCGGEAALEQSWMWDEETFNQFIKEQESTPEMEKTRKLLQETLQILPEYMPWKCLTEIRDEVDCSKIKLSVKIKNDESETPLEWKVKYQNKGKAGQEKILYTSFCWANREFLIPSIYLCGKGLVIDICMKVPQEKMRKYLNQYHLTETDYNCCTDAEREQTCFDNPMEFEFHVSAELNGRKIDWENENGWLYNPLIEDEPEADSDCEAWLEHYRLDRSSCWSFKRCHLPWITQRRPVIQDLWIELEQEKTLCSGKPFTVNSSEDKISITHPVTGNHHILNVLELQPETLENHQMIAGFACPKHLWTINYTLDPDLPRDEFSLVDCAESDSPIKSTEENHLEPVSGLEAEAIGIIGGADGPSAVIVTAISKGLTERSDCSALHFRPLSHVTWKPVFRIKQFENIRICLI